MSAEREVSSSKIKEILRRVSEAGAWRDCSYVGGRGLSNGSDPLVKMDRPNSLSTGTRSFGPTRGSCRGWARSNSLMHKE